MKSSDPLTIIQGDITSRHVDAIVNAANSSLLGGGGVDGAIHRAGGPEILAACRQIRNDTWPEGLPPGGAVVTPAGSLPARYVIHTVGPVWKGGDHGEETILERAIHSCFEVTAALQPAVRSIAFPAVSTGIYHFPRERAYRIILAVIRAHIGRPGMPDRAEFVLFSADDFALASTINSRG